MLELINFADCFTPDQALECLFSLLPQAQLPIPVEGIAKEVGIMRIEYSESDDFDGAMIYNEQKESGVIIVNNSQVGSRKRFTIGHELGHLLIQTHIPSLEGFVCTGIMGDKNSSVSPMEKEADYFSANLLMPHHFFINDIEAMGDPDLAALNGLKEKYQVSFEAFIRHFIDLTDMSCCAVFSYNGLVRYPYWNSFPYLCIRKGMGLPKESWATHYNTGEGSISEVEEIESYQWLEEDGQIIPGSIYEQTMCQSNGYKVTLLWFDQDLDDEEDVAWEPPRFKK